MAIKPLTFVTRPWPTVVMPAQTVKTQPRPEGEGGREESRRRGGYAHTPTKRDETEPGGRGEPAHDDVGGDPEEDVLFRFG